MSTRESSTAVLERPQPRSEASVDDAQPAVGPGAPVIEILATTRAMRRLAPDPVPPDLLRRVVEAATWAPSGANVQLLEYLVVTDRSTIGRLAPVWAKAIDDYRTLMAAAGAEFAGPMYDRMRDAIDYQRDHFADTPALIVVCEDPVATSRKARGPLSTMIELVRSVGPVRAFRLARAWQHATARSYGASVYPAVENLLLAARAHGLGATLTTWHLFREPEFAAVLGLPPSIRTYAIVPIGWSLGKFGRVNRRPVDEVLRLERW